MIKPIIDDKTVDKIRSLINSADNIVVTCHMSPDGDAIGSTLALTHVLRRMGKNARAVTPDMVPRVLNFLPEMRHVTVLTQDEDAAREAIKEAKLVFCLDFNTLARIDRLGDMLSLSRAPRVLIDHHLDPDKDEFSVMVSVPEASSTCELVFRLLLQMGIVNMVDRRTAQCLYTGLMTDTGNFTYSCDNPEVFEIASLLARRRIDVPYLYRMAMNTFSADSIRLQGYALCEKMQLFTDQGAALLTLTLDELKRFNYHRGDTESLVNKPLAIPEVNWVVFLREDVDRIKVSCRSKGDFSVKELCEKYYGGGGHTNAAGADFRGTLDQAVAIFYDILSSPHPLLQEETER
ncbi:MAG: bifunctional oligoribonuclease/PAP phosphatase NrnA [Muribaculaceae bacterium]|nr:bifunctional oligoribonuclease/PAP phosphatase NrnA [Muribaculaceae bacterium]